MKVIVIAPHHDDEVIGCGGSICLHKQQDDQVAVIYIFAGWSAIPSLSDKQEASLVVQEEAIKSGKILGINGIKELNIPDRSFNVGQEALYDLISTLRNMGGCDILYIPHDCEGDREHKITNELAQEAIWLAASDYLPDLGKKILSPKVILEYEVWTPLLSYQFSTDISSFISQKVRALEAYASQMKIKNWVDGCLGLNAYRGMVTGKGKFAEVFNVRKLKNCFMTGGVP